MDERLSRRERKKLETRRALLEAALTLFHEKGYDEATIEEITEEADVAKGTFFNYFPSKEAVLGELGLWRVEQLRAELDVGRGAPASPVARLKLLMRLMYEHAARHIELSRRAFAVRLCSPPPPPQERRRWLFGLFNDLVHEAQTSGEIRPDVDPELVSELLRIFVFQRVKVCSFSGNGLPPADSFDQAVDLLMDGLAGPNWRQI